MRFLSILNELCLKKSFGKRGFIIDKENEPVVELICQYFNRETVFEAEGRSLNKGLWIAGNFGSGKTLLMEAYVEMKRQAGDLVGIQTCVDMNTRFTDIDKFTGKPQKFDAIKAFANKNDKTERVFDDLGEEEITLNDYGNKICLMAYILGERYKGFPNGVVTHVTTNLTNEQVSRDYGGRIESRTMEMFNVIILGGRVDSIDYRKQNNKK